MDLALCLETLALSLYLDPGTALLSGCNTLLNGEEEAGQALHSEAQSV
jgi:hypothetical protein